MGRRRRAERLFEQALAAHREGRIDEADRHYREVLEADPRHAGALQHLGILAEQRGDTQEAVALLRRASDITPGDPRLLNNLGNALRSQGDATGAIEAYRAAVASDARYVNGLYNLAALLHDQDALDESEICYRRVITLEPADVGAWMELGLVLLDQDRGDDALACFERAAGLRPGDAVCHYNLGNALNAVGRLDDALAAFRRAVAISPDYAEAHHNLGAALCNAGDREGAESAFREALRCRPDYAKARVSLAALCEQRGDYVAAEALLRQALAADIEGRARLLLAIGRVLLAQARDREALEALKQALQVDATDVETRLAVANLLLTTEHLARQAADIAEQVLAEHPDHAGAHVALARAYLGSQRTSAAVAACREAIAKNDNVADLHCNLGLALRQQGDLPGAIEAFREATRIEPAFAGAHNNLGLAYLDAGAIDRALECFRDALRLDPAFSIAWLNMSQARRFDDADLPEIARIESLLDRGDIPAVNRINLHFALGKMLDDCKRYDEAFEHYRKGNAAKRRLVRFDADHYRAWVARIRGVFTAAFFAERAGHGEPSERPVFVVGMSRSGTTLVEQILASHPAVFGAGELTGISEILVDLEGSAGAAYPEFVRDLDQAAIRGAARRYLDALRSVDADAPRVTDKMPSNFFHLGFIALMFPGARIIHCRRDAMDTCLSNFVQQFREGHYYAYDLGDIAAYYRGYQGIMAHWREVLPIPMYEVQYEALVEEQERISRELIDYMGLEWDERCLAFHRSDRAVQTASNWQVRQPIYRSARKRWKHYERQLAQLKSDLEYVEGD